MAPPILVWFRRDLRLDDHAALSAATDTGRPVIPVFIYDDVLTGYGACPKWRMGLGVEMFSKRLATLGSRLILRKGSALPVLTALINETGATDVFWSRAYDPEAIARDSDVKAALKRDGIVAKSFKGHVLFEPWDVQTGAGGPYRVFTPFWRSVRERPVGPVLPPVSKISSPQDWPESDSLANWGLGDVMGPGAEIVKRHVCVGETAALERAETFFHQKAHTYAARRDIPAVDGTSSLSEDLTYGEVSVRRLWQLGMRARDAGVDGAEAFLRQLVWRDFAYHLAYHTPHILTDSWRPEWRSFPWKTTRGPDAEAWQQGRTGVPFVDAAMRELYVTGRVHNRARMISASFLTKHLLTHWSVGRDWYGECLVDWDPAVNALGWQWVAGSGPDAAPYFRIFNPETQSAKFDPAGTYVDRWIAEERAVPHSDALSFFDAAPRSWGLSADSAYPKPLVTLAAGRERALKAYQQHRGSKEDFH